MSLETNRLILRPWEETDAEECYQYAKDHQVGPAAGWPAHTSIENTVQVIRDVLMVPETYAIVLKETGLPIGSIGLHFHSNLAGKDDEAELGYWLGVPYWGRGIIPEAAREMLRHAFEDLNLNRVWCGYYDGNEKSRRVQRKLGFRHMWTSEDVPVPQMNETRRGFVNRMTKEEWTRLYRRIEGEHIVLRKAREDDYKSMLENVWGDEAVYGWMLFQPTFTDEEAIERCKRSMEFQKDHFAYFVALKDTDEAIGLCAMKELEPGHFDESGIGIGTKYQGRGYGKEIVSLLLELAFMDLGAADFRYGYYQDNARSRKVAQSFGFRYDRTEEMTRPWDGARKIIDSCLLSRQEYLKRFEKYPAREEAERLLEEAESCNPGPWGKHSQTAAHCAEAIAKRAGMNAEKAYVLGLLHDIGRKFGKRHLGHVSDGYSYMMSLGYDEVARICLTHSFNEKDISKYIGKFDTSEEETTLIKERLAALELDDYDRLIQLCDSIAGAEGVMDQIDRMTDVKNRYGAYDQKKWDTNVGLKEYFESRMGEDLYVAVDKENYRPV